MNQEFSITTLTITVQLGAFGQSAFDSVDRRTLVEQVKKAIQTASKDGTAISDVQCTFAMHAKKVQP